MAEMNDFQQVQRSFTAYLRNPENPIPIGTDLRSMQVYRELFYNNINGLLKNTFPVLHQLLLPSQWQTLTHDFFARHRSRTPLFPQIPQEFIYYLEQERGNYPDDPPFLTELAHYEWIVRALAIDPREISLTGIKRTGDLLQGCPVVNPIALLLSYRFPVYQISLDYQPKHPLEQPIYLVGYRDLADKVRFVELNPLSAYLLQKLLESEKTGQTGQTLLTAIAMASPPLSFETVLNGGLQIMQAWLASDILLGVLL